MENITIHKDAAADIADYIHTTQDIIEEYSLKIAELEKLSSCGTCGKKNCGCDDSSDNGGDNDEDTAKTDSKDSGDGSKYASLDHEVVESTVDKIVRAGLLKEGSRQQALQAIKDDAAGSLLGFIDKIAEQRIEANSAGSMMPKLGHAVPTGQESDSLQVRESDRAFEQCFDNLVI